MKSKTKEAIKIAVISIISTILIGLCFYFYVIKLENDDNAIKSKNDQVKQKHGSELTKEQMHELILKPRKH